MLQPFLVIGLGGSGGKTLQTMRDDLKTLLRQKGWESDELPAAWQLLQIDVPPTPGEIESDLPAPMSGDSYLGLARMGVGFTTIDHGLDERLRGNTLAQHAMAGWRPRADKVGVAVEKGAGQFRAIGRVLTVTYIDLIKAGIERAIARMMAPDAESQLKQAAKILGHRSDGKVPSPSVIVVSSIAGGTGAGMIIDVCDVLRLLGYTWTDESYALLFTPEVFDELPATARQGVRPNAFAALSEILAGFWDKNGFGDDESALLRMAGVSTGSTRRIGPRYPILVGQSNGVVRLSSQNDVYRAAGRALSAWISSEEVQSQIGNYLSGNWAQSGGFADRIPFKEQSRSETQETPFQAIGFGRVSLGRDRFMQYSAEFLSRRVIDRIKDGHLEGRDIHDKRSDDAILQDAVGQHWNEFLAESRLDLQSRVYDAEGHPHQILEEVRSSDVARAHLNELTARVMAMLDGLHLVEGMETTRATHFVADEMNNRRDDVMARYQSAAQAAVRAWAAERQRALIRLALAGAGRWGIPVTTGLLHGLSSHMAKNRRWLEDEAVKRENQHAVADLPAGQVIRVDATELRSYVFNHAAVVISIADARVLRGIAELLDDMHHNLIDPLIRDLEGVLASVRTQSANTISGQPTIYARWPVGRDVPRRLRPTQNERVLLHHEQFYDELINLLETQLSVASEEAAISSAISQILLYPVDRKDGKVERMARQDWVPQRPDFRIGAGTEARASKLQLLLSLNPEAILTRTEAWMQRPETPLGRLLGESLADYLDERKVGDTVVLEKRVEAYGRELSEAIKASAPLAAVSPAVAAVVHPGMPLEHARIFSGFPFAPGSRAGEVTEAVLRDSANMAEDDRRKLLNAEHKDPYVDVFSTLGAPMEAPVFDSLMKPLSQEWDRARSGGPDGLAKFWRFRRTRPLPQFIPMSPYVVEAMIRGWFTAQLLGQVRTGEASGAIEVFVPSPDGKRGMYAPFPEPLLLPEGYHAADRIAGILKTAMAALITVNATARLDAVVAYQRLLQLGTTRQGAIEDYQQLNRELLDWVISGGLPVGAPSPLAKWAGESSGTPESRRDAAYAQIESWWHGYEEKIFKPAESLEDLWDVPRSWELRSQYNGALRDIGRALRHTSLDDSGDDLV